MSRHYFARGPPGQHALLHSQTNSSLTDCESQTGPKGQRSLKCRVEALMAAFSVVADRKWGH